MFFLEFNESSLGHGRCEVTLEHMRRVGAEEEEPVEAVAGHQWRQETIRGTSVFEDNAEKTLAGRKSCLSGTTVKKI